MEEKQKEALKKRVREFLVSIEAQVYTWEALGFGTYQAQDGTTVRELSLTYVFESNRKILIKAFGKQLAKEFSQECVALIQAEQSQLIYAE
jgi:hypothetical protein